MPHMPTIDPNDYFGGYEDRMSKTSTPEKYKSTSPLYNRPYESYQSNEYQPNLQYLSQDPLPKKQKYSFFTKILNMFKPNKKKEIRSTNLFEDRPYWNYDISKEYKKSIKKTEILAKQLERLNKHTQALYRAELWQFHHNLQESQNRYSQLSRPSVPNTFDYHKEHHNCPCIPNETHQCCHGQHTKKEPHMPIKIRPNKNQYTNLTKRSESPTAPFFSIQDSTGTLIEPILPENTTYYRHLQNSPTKDQQRYLLDMLDKELQKAISQTELDEQDPTTPQEHSSITTPQEHFSRITPQQYSSTI